ncbi:hypothetical protein FP2506_17339 [Fulvimarina pelagi HTCC2506]|uniref:Uncharacterized protein n=1 Tax=Fulvimarina pelagi HTCC2506 TaxID=314231 RepID=Q0FY80_9HYPH|nr:hypothetical protein FP2506_17339 [Fulvimarina pelagi HTCC2506]
MCQSFGWAAVSSKASETRHKVRTLLVTSSGVYETADLSVLVQYQ